METFFFFQAEDGIRDGHVTGVQTCALPIFRENAATQPRIARAVGTAARARSTTGGWRVPEIVSRKADRITGDQGPARPRPGAKRAFARARGGRVPRSRCEGECLCVASN